MCDSIDYDADQSAVRSVSSALDDASFGMQLAGGIIKSISRRSSAKVGFGKHARIEVDTTAVAAAADVFLDENTGHLDVSYADHFLAPRGRTSDVTSSIDGNVTDCEAIAKWHRSIIKQESHEEGMAPAVILNRKESIGIDRSVYIDEGNTSFFQDHTDTQLKKSVTTDWKNTSVEQDHDPLVPPIIFVGHRDSDQSLDTTLNSEFMPITNRKFGRESFTHSQSPSEGRRERKLTMLIVSAVVLLTAAAVLLSIGLLVRSSGSDDDSSELSIGLKTMTPSGPVSDLMVLLPSVSPAGASFGIQPPYSTVSSSSFPSRGSSDIQSSHPSSAERPMQSPPTISEPTKQTTLPPTSHPTKRMPSSTINTPTRPPTKGEISPQAGIPAPVPTNRATAPPTKSQTLAPTAHTLPSPPNYSTPVPTRTQRTSFSPSNIFTPVPTKFPTSQELDQYLLDFLTLISPISAEAFTDILSPQYKAAEWLATNLPFGDSSFELTIEKFALATFYFSAGGEQWISAEKWMTQSHFCTWSSVLCDDNKDIISLALFENNIVGKLPPELSLLTNIEVLDLKNNGIIGAIPSEIGQLTKMEFLSLKYNSLSGSIPSQLGQMTKLVRMGLGRNNLSGSIPTEIGALTQIKDIGLERNDLSGTIPSEIGNLQKMRSLGVDSNRLRREIPTQLGFMSKLRTFHVDNNELTGLMPNEICVLRNSGGSSLKNLRADCIDLACACCTSCCTGLAPQGCTQM